MTTATYTPAATDARERTAALDFRGFHHWFAADAITRSAHSRDTDHATETATLKQTILCMIGAAITDNRHRKLWVLYTPYGQSGAGKGVLLQLSLIHI